MNITNGNDPIVQTVYRQIGKDSYRPATEKEIKEGIYLVHKEGLTKREYFAAMAMQGLLANPEWMKVYEGEKYLMMADTMATVSVERADALLSELNKS